MVLKINWTAKARRTYQDILDYLDEHWTLVETRNFITRTDSLLETVAQQPFIFKASKTKNIRKALVSKQTSMFYSIRGSQIYILSFWDNRRDPAKNKN